MELGLCAAGWRGCHGRSSRGFPADQDADPIGAGDHAAAGWMFALLNGRSRLDQVAAADIMGAWAASQPASAPGVPRRFETFSPNLHFYVTVAFACRVVGWSAYGFHQRPHHSG